MVSSPFDVWDRRHQTDRGHQQPAVGMRSETDQQHVCHQASVGRFGSPALNLLQHENKITACLSWRRPDTPTRHARKESSVCKRPSPQWTQREMSTHMCLLSVWLSVRQQGHDRGCRDWTLRPRRAVNRPRCLPLSSGLMSSIGDWPDFQMSRATDLPAPQRMSVCETDIKSCFHFQTAQRRPKWKTEQR